MTIDKLLPTKDTYYDLSYTNTNFGSQTSVKTGFTPYPYLKGLCMAFDFSSIPTDATITKATLYLTCSEFSKNMPDESFKMIIRPIRQAWEENTLTANTRPSAELIEKQEWITQATVGQIIGIDITSITNNNLKTYGLQIICDTPVNLTNFLIGFYSREITSTDASKAPYINVEYVTTKLKAWNGSQFVTQKGTFQWTGSTWVQRTPKRWTGTAWVNA